MARGNQREKAREANLKKQAATVSVSYQMISPQSYVVTDFVVPRQTEEREPAERNGATALKGGGGRKDEGEAAAG